MDNKIPGFVFLMTIIIVANCLGQRCEFVSKADDSINKRMGVPIIHGKPFPVPSLTWRFVGDVPPKLVEVRYQWQWIDYPYPDHAFGAWLTSGETVECREPSLRLEVPARAVQPRGWYQGTYTLLPWSKPRFHQVEFVVEWGRNCRHTVMLSPQLLEKFRDHDGVLPRSCGEPVEIRFVRKGK